MVNLNSGIYYCQGNGVTAAAASAGVTAGSTDGNAAPVQTKGSDGRRNTVSVFAVFIPVTGAISLAINTV
jgi:hypothetical protein